MTNAYAPSILRQTLCRDSESNNKQKANFPVKNLSRKRIRAVAVLLFAIALFAPRIVWGQFEYNGGSTTDYLSTAIYYANAGSTIYVTGDNGNLAYYNERIDLTKSITIKSNVGGTKRTIKRVGNNQWIRVAGTYTLTIEDIVLDGQNYNTSFSMIQGSGGASITMYNCEVKNCYKSGNAQGSSNNGAAINISGASSDLTCVSVIFQNNINTETHTPIGSVVYGGGGVAIGNQASFTLTSCEFYGNEAYEGGGAIYMEQAGTGSIRGCTIGKSGSGNANKAGIVGGGIYGNTYKGYTVTIDGTTSIQYNEVVVMDGNGNDKGYFGQGGVYFINGRDTGNITIGDAAGSNKVNISNNKARGGAGGVMFWCTATSESVMTIQNFTMENNYGGNTTHNFYDSEFNFGGGGIFVVGSLDVTHSADHIIIKNGTISDRYAVGYGGGLFINNHDCVVRNVTFTNNYTTNDPSSNRSWGGAVMVNGKVSGSDYSHTDYFYNCVFHKNGIKRADKTVMTTDGGALYSHRITNVQMLGCTIGGSMANANKATNNGGGIHMGQNSYLTLDKYGTTSTKVSYNEAGSNGGGIYVADGSQGHTNIGSNSTGYPVEISNNKAEQNGGGIYLDCGGYNDDQFTLCNFKLNENTALHGGGAYLLGEHVSGVNHGAMTISNGEVKDNHATSMGGGIYFDEHDATVTSVDFIHNTTNTGTDTSVPSGIGVGGGVLMAGHSNHTVADHDHDFTNCSFIQNKASVGGAALVMRKTNATFNNCSIGGNTANKNIASIDGGGVYVEELSKTNFINGTMVSYNEAKNGGGVYVAGYEGSGNPNDYMNVVCEASVSAPSSYGAYFGIYTKNGSTYTLVSGSSMTLTGSSSGVIRESNLQKNVNYYVLARPIPNDEVMYRYPIICSMSGIAGTIQIYNSSWSSPTGYSNYVWNKPAWSSLSGLAHGTVTIGSTSYYDIIHFRVVPDEDVDASGYATVNGSTVSNNKASNQGGGIYIEKLGEVLLDGSNALLVQSNTANDKGGGVYKLGTLKVKGNTTVTENISGTAKAVIRNNVYIPANSADDQTILIADALTCGSSIGVTKTKTDHTYDDDDNFNQVRTAIAKVEPASPTQTWALDAYHNNVFFDDTDKFGVWSFNYHKTNDANDYSAQNDYFIETWRSYANDTDTDIESSSSGYFTNVKSNKGLAYFAKMVNSGLDYASLQTYLVADIDLAGHYWEPIGFSTGSTCNPVTDYKFSGNFDGQGHLIRNAISILPAKTMGLFGNVDGGSVIHTFNIGADFTGTFDGETHIGGIAGQVTGSSALIDRCEAQGSMQRYGSAASNTGGIAGNVASGEVRNSFAVSSNLSGTTVGGLVGKNAGSVKNAYAVNNTLPGSGTVGALVGNNTGTLSNAYTDASSEQKVVGSGSGSVTNVYSAGATGATATYTATIGADQLGYMYADNLVGTTPLFELLTTNAKAMNATASAYLYDLWARPALAYYVNSNPVSIEKPINADLPLLMMDDKTFKRDIEGGATVSTIQSNGLGNFRAVSTISNGANGTMGNGHVLQYSGPLRDYDEVDIITSYDNQPAYSTPIEGMLDRSTASDCHFIYGDVEIGSTVAMNNTKANRISIYEHAAITQTGTLGSFDKTHVSITFDNSRAELGGSLPVSTNGMNGLDAQGLKRDWHLLSTPLLEASTGFDYKKSDGTETNTNDLTYSNNPWAGGGSATTPGGTEFGWLGGGNNRYWMTGWTGSQTVTSGGYVSSAKLSDWTDGYFPSTFDASLHSFNQGCIEGTNEYNRYPYGMDFYSWYEPKYHYINFKRNGPNHWHSDEPHVHLDYTPETASNYASPQENVNEEILLAGKGYFASIAEKTLLQSSGQLGTNTNKTIEVTCSTYPNTVPLETGWNLVGNPFHAYLDFDQLCEDNSGKITENRYLVYNADGFNSTDSDDNSGHYGNGFSYYVKSGSVGGAYAHRYLHPHQGFFVKVGSGPTLNFTESQTVLRSQIGTSGSYRDDSRPAYPLVNLFLTSDKGCSDVCVVEFNRPEWGGATKLRDMYSGNGLFYAAHDNGNYAALFATPEAERIPLKFEAKDEAGDTYTIHWNTQKGDFHKLYLVDNITGVQYDMLRNSSYSFSGKKDDYWTRFYITFEVTGLDEEQDDEDDDASTGSASTTFAFFDGSQWVVTNDGHGTATLDLIDLQGRVLHSTTLAEGQARIGLPDVAKGMYLMRMTNQNGMFVQKIVVR